MTFFRDKFCAILCCALMLAGVAVTQVANAEREYKTVRFMSYNVRHCQGLNNNYKVDVQLSASVIKEHNPDVIALQELDSMCTRSNKAYQINGLSRFSGMKYAYFAKAIPLQGGGYGVGIMSKTPALSIKKVPLPGTEARVLLIAEFEDFVYACTHFDLDDEMRAKSVEIVTKEMTGWKKPFLIAGDWNDTPTSSFIKSLSQYLTLFNTKLFTFPADKPTSCIDYIATYKKRYAVECEKFFVGSNDHESDHRPIIADVKIPITTTGVNGVAESEIKAVVKGKTLTFRGATEQDKISVYTIDGMSVVDGVSPRDIRLSAGLYVVKMNDETMTFSVK